MDLLSASATGQQAQFIPPKAMILIVDEHRLCRDRLYEELSYSHNGISLRTAPLDLGAIVRALPQAGPTIVLLSCCSEALRLTALSLAIRVRVPSIRIVALGQPQQLDTRQLGTALPFDAVIRSPADLAAVIYAIAAAAPSGTRWGPTAIRRRPLTPREAEIVQHVAAGSRNADIATALGIAEKTVKVNLTNIYGKFGIRCRLDLIELAPQLLSSELNPWDFPEGQRQLASA
jgi:DNA-binding NarL/FixJ family response regulator